MMTNSKCFKKGESMAKPKIMFEERRVGQIDSVIIDTSECYDGATIEVAEELNKDFKNLCLWPFEKKLIGGMTDVIYYRLQLSER